MAQTLNARRPDGPTMDPRWRDRFDHALMVGGLIMAAVGILGEVLGWWGELGLVLTIGGFAAGIYGAVDVHGRALLRLARPMAATIASLPAAFEALHTRHDAVDARAETMLVKQDAMLEKQDAMLATQDAMLQGQATLVRGQAQSYGALVRIGDLLDQRLPR